MESNPAFLDYKKAQQSSVVVFLCYNTVDVHAWPLKLYKVSITRFFIESFNYTFILLPPSPADLSGHTCCYLDICSSQRAEDDSTVSLRLGKLVPNTAIGKYLLVPGVLFYRIPYSVLVLITRTMLAVGIPCILLVHVGSFLQPKSCRMCISHCGQ